MSRIVNFRGTSGSGKTTLVHRVMSLYLDRKPVHIEGRKQPLYYTLTHPGRGRDLAVLGHYETACGGCDTITELDEIFALAKRLARDGFDVLMEGLLVSGEIIRTAQLSQELRLYVLTLNTPIDDCVANINKRRVARGVEEPVRPKNTIAKDKTVRRVMERLKTEAECSQLMWGNADELYERAREIFNV